MRCKISVIDPYAHRQRKCLNKNCKDCPMVCATHARQFAIKIQRMYRGYKTRRKINLFQKLPSELWDRILYFTRYQHNIQTKFRRSVMKINCNRLHALTSKTHTYYYAIADWGEPGELVDNTLIRLANELILTLLNKRIELKELFDNNDIIVT